MKQDPNIADWSKAKLVQFVEDNFEDAKAGGISFLFSADGTLGWLNESGSAVTFSNQGTYGDGSVTGYAVNGSAVSSLPVAVAEGQLFEVSAVDVDGQFYVSFKVK